MEPISYAASMLTLVSVFPFTVATINGLVEAPKTLQKLADQLCRLSSAVTSIIGIAQAQGLPPCSLNALYSIRDKVEVVQATFDTRIRVATSQTVVLRFRRSIWVRRRDEIKKIEKEMATITEELAMAISTVLLSSMGVVLHELRHNPSTSATARLPNWALERSNKFYPECYVIEQPRQQQLLIFSMHEVDQTAASRVATYYLLCPIDARHWKRVIVFATKPTTQHQSRVSAARNQAYKILPGLVQPQLERLLFSQITILCKSVVRLYLKLEVNSFGDVIFDPKQCEFREDLEGSAVAETSRYMEEIKYRGLPQFRESQVLTLAHEADFFFVLVESQVHVECKLPFSEKTAFDQRPVDNFITDIKMLLAAQGCDGIATFSGFVVDDDRSRLQSYLLRAPYQGRMWTVMASSKEAGEPVSWTRRERWFQQLIAMTADVHERGLTVGYHPRDMYNFFIDSQDNVKCMRLSSHHANVPNEHGSLAPEIRSVTQRGAVAESYPVSVNIDLFNLGLTLWQIVQYVKAGNHILCRSCDCEVRPRYRCIAEHTNPILLPFDKEKDVPAYVRAIINHCRQENPMKRLSAVGLLSLLPSDESLNEHVGTTAKSVPWQDPEHSTLSPTCDECGNTSKAHYHCNVCQGGDFDLCPSCYAANIRCHDDNHVMLCRVPKNGTLINMPLKSEI